MMASFAIADQVKDTNAVNDHAKLLSNGLPQPPIPQRLREMLKDYPGHLERLQEVLNTVLDGNMPARGSTNHVFEQVIWALEGRLETFIREATSELKNEEASGDAEAIAHAEAKERLMFRACSSNGGLRNLSELSAYIKQHQDVLK
jgi:hypothetical protein